jgi:hypothetical protein
VKLSAASDSFGGFCTENTSKLFQFSGLKINWGGKVVRTVCLSGTRVKFRVFSFNLGYKNWLEVRAWIHLWVQHGRRPLDSVLGKLGGLPVPLFLYKHLN